MKQSRFDRGFSVFIGIMSCLMIIITLYPLYFLVIASLSNPYQVVLGKVFLWPKGFTIEAYRYIIRNKTVWRGFFNSSYLLTTCIPQSCGELAPR